MSEEILANAISLVKLGHTREAKGILVNLLRQDPQLGKAWGWLYMCVSTDEERIYCLREIVNFYPDSEDAKIALKKLTDRLREELGHVFTKTPFQANGQETKEKTNTRRQSVLQTISLPNPSKPSSVMGKINIEPPRASRVRQAKSASKKSKKSIADQNTDQSQEYVVNHKKPTIIFTKPEENLFASSNIQSTRLPEVDSAMYGSRLIIGGLSITLADFPKCIELGRLLPRAKCQTCDFFSEEDCPFQHDSFLLHDSFSLFSQRLKYRQEAWEKDIKRRESILRAIYIELRAHGRPLHYEVIGKIMLDRYPELDLTVLKILRYLGRHPERFEWVEEGVYKAK
jgi:hypothetical protein